MDAVAQLALMTKAKIVFESADTFLSFPALLPLSYAPDQLKFLPVAQNLTVFAEFCEITNALPQSAVFRLSLDSALWKVYLNVLGNAQLAQGTLSDQESADLQQAQAFLRTQTDDGRSAPSAAVLAYNQYQQEYIRATQIYKTQQLSAQASNDPNVQSQWQNVDEPALRGKVDAAQSDWEKLGFKAQVENARQVVLECTAKSPALQWKEWQSQCNPDIDFLTDANNQTFAPTVYLPYDILDQGNWPSFTMTGQEIQQLASQAPSELSNIVGTATPNSTLDSLSFEFCSVALNRPWFHSEVFAARFWKFSDASVELSDGKTPPQGQWPAYISALVFARNITVTMHTVGGGTQKQILSSFPQILMQSQPTLFHPILSIPIPPKPAVQPVHPTPIKASPAIAMMAMHTAAPLSTAPATAAQAPAAAISISPAVMMRLNAGAFSAQPGSSAPASSPAPSGGVSGGPTSNTQPSSGVGQVSILAFVCKRLPQCPNPDQSLQWS